jgi:hypothetical protein
MLINVLKYGLAKLPGVYAGWSLIIHYSSV